jgi:solute carrier family 25 2-oxodicarboxylate transporter 21
MSGSTNSLLLFGAGAITGIVETLVIQPLDMVKTRLQLLEGSNQRLGTAFNSVYREGGVFRFYRGVLPELVGSFPTSSVMLATAEIAKRQFTEWNGGVCNTYIAFSSGIVSGYSETFVTTPFQVIKVRMQAKEHLGRYSDSVQCFRNLLRTEGVLSLFIGLGPSFWRNCSWNSVYFACLYKLKTFLPRSSSAIGDGINAGIAGAVSGGVACTVYSPFDVVKSRFQSQIYEPGVKPKYRYTVLSLVNISREEGIKALYKGLSPALLRMIVGAGVMAGTFEVLCHMISS